MTFATHKSSFIQAAVNPGNSAGPRIHTYKSDDAHAVVHVAGYFNAIADLLRIGDLIYHAEVTNWEAPTEAINDAQWFVVITISDAGVVVTSIETEVVVAAG